MLEGRDVWDLWVQKDMKERQIGRRTIYTFSKMKKSFYEMLEDTAARYPDKAGLCDNWERSYTYQEFLHMVNNLAAYLQNVLHVRKKSHVGLLLNNGIEFAASFYAVCKLGAVAVPFPTKYREPEIQALVDKADLHCILVSEDYGSWAPAYEDAGIVVLCTRDEEQGYGFQYLDFPEEEMSFTKGGCGELEDEMILMFTSGTTSASKGVILKNYNINHAVMIYQRLLALGPDDKTIIPVPVYHITGLVALLGLFIYMGATVYLYKRYDARRILEGVDKHQITFMHGSPTVFGMLLDYQQEFPKLKSIRTLACGSSYMPVETMKKLHKWMPEMKFQNVYGMTETASPGTVFPYDAATSIYPGSSGKPVPGVAVKILDGDGVEVKRGEAGTVFLKGANICEYYYQIETPLISADGWLNTGDVGYINEDSYVFIVDREKDMINRGGEKIWCTDVEEEILSLSGVKDVAVVGIPHRKYGEAAAAVVVLETELNMTEEELKNRLRNRLAKFKIPEKVIFMEAVPKTAGLKTDKKYIRTLFEKGNETC
jgi:acyl-CoA synthetase (AMP-forming)/AMP-acid ligase II